MRAFVAIDPDEDAADALQAVQAGLPLGRIVPRAALHLTLAFLDDQPQHVLAALDDELRAVRARPFRIALRGLGMMGEAVVMAEALPTPPLDALHAAVAQAARRAGIVLDRRRFRPHVTLARLRGAGDARLGTWIADRAGFAADMSVGAFSLYRSDLHPKGARHTELATYPLA